MVSPRLLRKARLSNLVASNYQTYNHGPPTAYRQEEEEDMTGQRTASVRFTEKESEYLMTQRLARVATVSPSSQPHVVPITYEFDGNYIYFSGWNISKSLKFRNLQMNNKVAIVVDDIATQDRWSPRGIEIRGTAEPIQCDGGVCLKITPLRKTSWGI
jgi:pyridoxamine 5'-phosphate oxidase family protein